MTTALILIDIHRSTVSHLHTEFASARALSDIVAHA